MNRIAVLISLAACGTGSAPQTARMEPINAPVARTGRHSTSIQLVAATESGTAAVTQDNRGGTRLWPSLDGLREPVVIPMNRAQQLLLGQTLTGFVIAGLDEAGGVEIIAVAGNGRIQAQTRLAPEPAIEAIAMRQGELIALRADQTIEIIDPAGQVRAHMAAPAGQRIASIVTRGPRALALFESEQHLRGMWLADASWGASISTIQILATPSLTRGALRLADAALSPSGTRIAVPIDRGIAIANLQTTEVEIESEMFADRIVLADDRTIVALQSGLARVRDIESAHDEGAFDVGTSPVLAGSRILSGKTDQLELCTPPYTRVTPHGVGPRVDVELVPVAKQYLGYRIGNLAGVRVTPTGLTVSGGSQDLVELAPDLHEHRRTELPSDARTLKDTVRLDDRHVLASHAYSETSFAVSVLDTRTNLTLEILSTPVSTPMLRYEPSTELLAVSDSVASYLLRRNPATSKFETWFRVGSDPVDLRVLDPAKAGGVVAMALREDAEPPRTRVERIRANQLVVGHPISAGERFYNGSLLGIDARGRVYVADGDTLVGWDGERELVRIPGALSAPTPLTLGVAPPARPHVVVADHYIALVQDQRVSLFDDEGATRWDIDAPSLRDVGWMGNALVAHFEGGLAKLDLGDGHTVDATCGWAFGLSDKPGSGTPGEGVSICEAP